MESGIGTYGSRGTVTAGNAAHLAAGKLVAEARSRAAELWGVSADVIKYEGGELGAGGQRITIGELAARKRLATGASFNVPKVTYAGCGVAVIADIDADTGLVRLRRVVVGADVGRAVNPALVDGQLVGGVAFGIGNTLLEGLEYDADGQLLTGTLMDYALPLAADVPVVDGFYQEVAADESARAARARRVWQPGARRRHRQCRVRRLPGAGVAITALPLTPARVREAIRTAGL